MPLNAKFEEVRAEPFSVGRAGVVSALLSPTETSDVDPRGQPSRPAATRRATRPKKQASRPAATAGRGTKEPSAPAPASTFTGGRARQVQVSIDVTLSARLVELAQTSRLSASALLVAIVHAALPTDTNLAARAILEEMRVTGDRLPQGPRIPTELRDRLDELTQGAKSAVPKATRSDLVNAILRSGMPADATEAQAVHDRYVKAGLDAQEAALTISA